MNDSVEAFFDSLGDGYASAIERCVPRYREMLSAILDGLPEGFRPKKVLDLGAGNGNLSIEILKRHPSAELHLVDISAKALETARSRFEGIPGLVFTRASFEDLDFAPGSFDLVTSSIAIHHLPDPGKRILFDRCFRWLSRDGVLAYSDQFSSVTRGGMPET
ncbi:MAG: class I SAM-dependent methyltransferase [Planctomycetota bacterium]|jgi:tRNA (cmo5U34)-methyltransferase